MQRFLTRLLLGATLLPMVLAPVANTTAMAASSGSQKQLGDVLVQNTPATHFIWTDKLWYEAGATQTLRWTFDPQGEAYPFTVFVYRENITTGERMYVSNGSLTADVHDVFGNAPGSFLPMLPSETRAQVLYTGGVPATGNYHFVAELRDVTATQIVKRAWAKFNVVSNIVTMGANGQDTEISSDATWTADTVYRIYHQVFVNDGATLTIEPGTIVVANGQNAVLVIERGGKIMAQGRRELPIVMTCDGDMGERYSGCWAGIILLGKATHNFAGNAIAEGVIPATRPVYGGNDDDDSSGVLEYVRVEFAGVDFSNEIQPNAFGFHGIGRGTVIRHIQAHEGEDDGIEFFGGTANLSYFVSDGSKDDSLDSTFGWRGVAQFGFILQDAVEADRGYEGDGNENGFANTPLTDPKIWNVTFVGQQSGGRGLNPRRGHKGTFNNNIIMNFGNDGIDPVLADAGTDPKLNANLFWLNAGGKTGLLDQNDSQAADILTNGMRNIAANPLLRNIRFEGNPDPRPRDGSPALMVGAGLTPPSSDVSSPEGSFIGGFSATENWLEEWTFFGSEDNYDADPSNDTITPDPNQTPIAQ
ncbi:MAG: hypothetical protein R2748_21435 [Bryobacterales bacterium]